MPYEPEKKKAETTRRKASEYGEVSGRPKGDGKKPSQSVLDQHQRDKSVPRSQSGPPLPQVPIADYEPPDITETDAAPAPPEA